MLWLLQVLLGVTSAIYSGSYRFMSSMARPTFAVDGSLLDGGIDLNMNEGMAEYDSHTIIVSIVIVLISIRCLEIIHLFVLCFTK